MKKAFVIAKKDFVTSLTSPGFYLVGFLFLAFAAYSFNGALAEFAQRAMLSSMNYQGQAPTMNLHLMLVAPYLGRLHLAFLMFIPFLTARLVSEEKRARTMDLLLTSPVTATEIAVGKLLAGLLTVWTLLGAAALFPIALSFVTEVSWGPFWSALLGMFILSSMYVAIGVFCSSLTESSVVAGIMSIVSCLMLLLIYESGNLLDDGLAKDVLTQISLVYHMDQLFRGVVHTGGLVLLASFLGFFGFLTQRVIESARWR